MDGGSGVAMGKGAWDCDTNRLIPPEKEAEVFEEIATMDYPFEGIPTVPPRKDMDHLELIYAGQILSDNSAPMSAYRVPPGCQCLIAIERAKLRMGKPDPDAAFWN
ncbi:uncharacterized protein HaLaN_01271 [Haematococcus lacustris]|uniref:Ubiquitin-like domain-containing protein n=1 Tax=Haematococcus lacustris TaxID=44745 RepID=A0A699YBA2_HAELA|nr:uncharacterized protein HaLaN_01271 [Haematococcus lacustris]